jgi:hypothetical protein
MQPNKKKIIRQGPVLHRPKNIRGSGGEMLTWMKPGLFLGATIGLMVGVIVFLIIRNGSFLSLNIANQPIQNVITLFIFIVAFSGVFGGFAGTLIGIGMPKFNPYPHQGLYRRRRDRFKILNNGDSYE